MYISEMTPFWWAVYRWSFLLLIPCAVFAAIGVKAVIQDFKASKEEEQRIHGVEIAMHVAKYHENQGYGYYL